ncbi:hypothetical protein BDA96_05G241400 [Sorghum bicolor]|uniref:Uncharacterized protein n=1 Tax=Sorghum bicolor TaxID=4558 RepID=A0A921UGD3_SORBI|nr:hypothetical protein BDA96_05G241400 [Sorghum bicolor]KAG0531059.1 hypothetical protein BDA96_05G241400 [Sorghum bicolor]
MREKPRDRTSQGIGKATRKVLNVTTGAEGSVKHVKLIHFCRQRLDFVSCGPRLLLDPRVILVHHYMVTQEVRAELKISRHFRPVSPFNV